MNNRSRLNRESKVCVTILAILAICCILPLLTVASASFTDNRQLQLNGYSLLPVEPTLDTYIFMFTTKGSMLFRSIFVTLAVTVLGTLYQVAITTLFAYAVTQQKEVFRFTRVLSFLAWFTTVFSGGVIPWYILCTRYYGLKDNLFALFVPYGFNVFNMFILRSSFRSIPESLIESAKLDGASNSVIFSRIALPLARAGVMTVTMFAVFSLWNDFFLPQWLVTSSDYQTLQKLLYNMLSNVSMILQSSDPSLLDKITLPTETAKAAVAVIALLPMVCIYPFTLKYVVKGVNVGGVKG